MFHLIPASWTKRYIRKRHSHSNKWDLRGFCFEICAKIALFVNWHSIPFFELEPIQKEELTIVSGKMGDETRLKEENEQ